MSLWSEAEFQRVAHATRLADSSLNACREVLVLGLLPSVAARNNKLLPAQVSRSLATLRDRKTEVTQSNQDLIGDAVAVLKGAAGSLARSLLGDGVQIFDPSAGQEYEGPVLAVQHGFVVQKLGRFAALHELEKFTEIPRVGAMLAIVYPRDGGKPSVTDLGVKGRETGPDVGR